MDSQSQRNGMLMETYGLHWTSPALFPEKAEGYVDIKGLPAPKLVKKAKDMMSQEIKKQKLSQNEAGAYWAKNGRLPTGTLANRANEPVYILQKSIWIQDPKTKEVNVLFGDRYDIDTISHIPSGISALGDTFDQNVSSEEQSLIENSVQGIHLRRKEVRDMRGCTSTDNCFGLPTYVFFLPVICCLGGCCYDQLKQKQVVSRVAEVEEEYIEDLNATSFGPKGMALKTVKSTYYTLQYIGRNEIQHNGTDTDTSVESDQTYRNVMKWRWEITPITLRWLELRRADNKSDSPKFPLPSRAPASLFGSVDPKSPKQLSLFRDTVSYQDMKVGMNQTDLFV